MSGCAPDHRVEVAALLDEVRQRRVRCWAETRDYPRPGFATLAVRLPELPGQPPMAVTLGMRLQTLQARADALRQALQEAAQRLVPQGMLTARPAPASRPRP
ncbi:MAG TPA: hypothetical protein VMS38_34340 [Pseudorhodoferax sp.]|nr:hypothetical protein [Pseudorhodoferax sp.]